MSLSLRRLFIALMALALFEALPSVAAHAGSTRIRISATPIPLHQDKPEFVQVGRLRYRGGLELRSPDRRFGGFSGLLVSPDGRRLIAISDHGFWLRARIVRTNGRLTGLRGARMGRLVGPRGRALRGAWRDAEGLARRRGGGIIVSFERHHRLLAYRSGRRGPRRPFRLTLPKGIQRAHSNKGMEAITRLADGGLLVLTEGLAAGPGLIRGWIRPPTDKRGTWRPLAYARTDAFLPTGADLLPNGDVVVLERSFSFPLGLDIRLQQLARRDIVPGARLAGREIARLAAPLNVDNFEGISAYRGTKGRTFLAIISDDNYQPFQRTLLLTFELVK